ncbi:hypothetical protein QFZ60_003331 [Arthrobacter sp. B2I5]|nr:hypothetical protein [Arthrobacter sp. B2I5]
MYRQRVEADYVVSGSAQHALRFVACLCCCSGDGRVGDWADSGDVRLRERHVRSAGVFATEHAEEFGQAHPTLPRRHVRSAGVFATEPAEEFGQAHPNPATIDRTRVLVRKTRYGCWRF